MWVAAYTNVDRAEIDQKFCEFLYEKAPENLSVASFNTSVMVFHSKVDGGICILDDSLEIDWLIPTDKVVLSDRDTKPQMLNGSNSSFDYGVFIVLTTNFFDARM